MSENLFEDLTRGLERHGIPSLREHVERESASSPENLLEETSLEEEPDTEQQEQTPAMSTDWVVHLRSVNSYELNEFGRYDYNFVRIKDPNDIYTDKFAVFGKMNGSEDWNILNGLLSDRYGIAKTETFVNELRESIAIVGEPTLKTELFKTAWIADLSSPVELWEEEAAKIAFAIVTGTDIDDINNINSNVSVVLMNSYDGKSRLRLDYALTTRAAIDGSIHKFQDYFSMVSHSTRIVHSRNLVNVNHDIDSMRQNIISTMTRLKETSISDDDQIIEKLVKAFNAEGGRVFENTWIHMVPDYRNLYYLCIVASIILDKYWSSLSYARSRSILERKIKSELISNR